MRPEVAASEPHRTEKQHHTCEDGRLREAGVHDPYLRYPHSYTRRDIATALRVAEDQAA